MSNVQLDLVITDTYGGKPVKKTVSMLVMSGRASSIRTTASIPTPRPSGPYDLAALPPTTPVHLNLDANVLEINNQLINVAATFEFTPAAEAASGAVPPSVLRQSMNVVLRNGKPLLVSRSADPVSDRTVTVELTATIREQ